MKTFRQFMLEATADIFGDEAEQARVRERDAAQARRRAYRNVNVSSQDAGFGPNTQPSASTQTPPRQPSGSTQTPPRQPSGSTQTPPRQPSGTSTPPPPPPPKPSSMVNVNTPKGGPKPRVRLPGWQTGLSAAGAAFDAYQRTKERQASGERLRTALPKSAAEAGGGWAGAELAATAAAKVLPKNPLIAIPGTALAGVAGYYGGKGVVSDVIRRSEGKGTSTSQEVEKAAQQYGMRKAKAGMRQANVYGATKGSGISGLGGQMKVNQKAGTITTQGKTAKLGSTQLIRDPKTGEQVVGDLAYKGGKPTYIARPSTASRDANATPGGLWRNVQRSLNIGGQRERDVAAAKQEYRTALKNTQQYQRQLGISNKQATAQKLPGTGVGPKKVGPKFVGPKIVGPKKS